LKLETVQRPSMLLYGAAVPVLASAGTFMCTVYLPNRMNRWVHACCSCRNAP
jgi:hypothetical protein